MDRCDLEYIFMRYKGGAFFPLSEGKKNPVENIYHGMCGSTFFDDSEIAIGCGGTWGLSEYTDRTSKIICLYGGTTRIWIL